MSVLPRGKNALPTLVILSLLGLLGNYLKIGLFFNVDFLFGGIFSVLAIKLFGFYGVAAALVASLYTYVLWNHPYAIIIFTAEALFLAYFRRQNKSLVIADIFYWLVVGVPLIFVTYKLFMGMKADSVILVMLKQSINGIFCALIGSVLYDIILYLQKINGIVHEKISYQHIVFNLFTFMVLIPLTTYVIISVRSNLSFTSDGMKTNMNAILQSSRISVNTFLKDNIDKVMVASEIVKSHMTTKRNEKAFYNEIQSMIDTTNSHFVEIGLISSEFISHSVVTSEGKKPVFVSGQDFSFLKLSSLEWRSREVYVSDVHHALIKGKDRSVIYILTPVLDSGGLVREYVYGAIRSDDLEREISSISTGSGVDVLLLDRWQRVMISTDTDYGEGNVWKEIMADGSLTDVGMGVDMYTPAPRKNVSLMSRWRKSFYMSTAVLSDSVPFIIVARESLAPYVSYMNEYSRKALATIFTAVLASALISYFLSFRITRQISSLSRMTRNLPAKIVNDEKIDWPDSMMEETVVIADNFMEMAEELKAKFRELDRQKEYLSKLLDNAPSIIFLKDTDNNIIRANRLAAAKVGMLQSELEQMPVCNLFPDSKYHEEDKEVIATGRPKLNVITKYVLPAGGEMIAKTSRIPLFDDNGKVEFLLVMVDDITEETRAAEEKQKLLNIMNQQSKMAEMGAMINIITHQWKQPLNIISLLAQNLAEDSRGETLKKDELEKELKLIIENTEFLAQTVRDFSDFFKKTKSVEKFSVSRAVREVYNLLERQFVKEEISVEIDDTQAFEVNGLRNEFKQVILNLLNNAKDSLAVNGLEDKKVSISFRREQDKGVIIIGDNGGGIEEHLLPDRVFEPYVSTKGDKGSGIGLFVSRSIIRDHMEGSITAGNRDGGAVFEIAVPYVTNGIIL